MAAHRVDLGDQGDLERWIGFGNSDGSTKATTTSANDGNIGLYYVHFCLLEKRCTTDSGTESMVNSIPSLDVEMTFDSYK